MKLLTISLISLLLTLNSACTNTGLNSEDSSQEGIGIYFEEYHCDKQKKAKLTWITNLVNDNKSIELDFADMILILNLDQNKKSYISPVDSPIQYEWKLRRGRANLFRLEEDGKTTSILKNCKISKQ